ncbi:MAG: hypothetical protein Q9217_006243 [Psora testacea]
MKTFQDKVKDIERLLGPVHRSPLLEKACNTAFMYFMHKLLAELNAKYEHLLANPTFNMANRRVHYPFDEPPAMGIHFVSNRSYGYLQLKQRDPEDRLRPNEVKILRSVSKDFAASADMKWKDLIFLAKLTLAHDYDRRFYGWLGSWTEYVSAVDKNFDFELRMLEHDDVEDGGRGEMYEANKAAHEFLRMRKGIHDSEPRGHTQWARTATGHGFTGPQEQLETERLIWKHWADVWQNAEFLRAYGPGAAEMVWHMREQYRLAV